MVGKLTKNKNVVLALLLALAAGLCAMVGAVSIKPAQAAVGGIPSFDNIGNYEMSVQYDFRFSEWENDMDDYTTVDYNMSLVNGVLSVSFVENSAYRLRSVNLDTRIFITRLDNATEKSYYRNFPEESIDLVTDAALSTNVLYLIALKCSEDPTFIDNYTGYERDAYQTSSSCYIEFYFTIYEKVTAPEAPAKTGYTFDGWFYDEQYQTRYNGEEIYSNISLYSKYTPITYSITYTTNGGELVGATSSYNIEQTVGLVAPSRTGYTFKGWFDNAAFSGSAVTQLALGNYGNKTFYAKWEINVYNISYTANGGSLSGQTLSYTYESGAITLAVPTRTGYTFKGWYTNASFDGSAVTSIPSGSLGNKAFYAKWEIVFYAIAYQPISGELVEPVDSYTVETATFTLVVPTRYGYTFIGWYEDKMLTGSAVVEIAKGSTGDRVFYAKWQIITYTVTFIIDGEVFGTVEVPHGSKLEDVAGGQAMLEALREVYTDEELQTIFFSSGITEELTVYGEWTPDMVKWVAAGNWFVSAGNWLKDWWWAIAIGLALVIICVPVLVYKLKG